MRTTSMKKVEEVFVWSIMDSLKITLHSKIASVKVGGGVIFIYNGIQSADSTYSINLKFLTFDSCK